MDLTLACVICKNIIQGCRRIGYFLFIVSAPLVSSEDYYVLDIVLCLFVYERKDVDT